MRIPLHNFLRRWSRAAFFLTLLSAVVAAAQTPLLTNVLSVLELDDAALAAKPALELRGVITCSDSAYALLFVQDETGGIFIHQVGAPGIFRAGDLVTVRGAAARGLLLPMAAATEITVQGRAALPTARFISIGTLNTGSPVGDRVELRGVVQRARVSDGHLFLHLVNGENRCTVMMPHAGALPDLLDTRVAVRGVGAATFNRNQQLTGFQLCVQDMSELEVIFRPAAPAWDAPLCSSSDLIRQSARRTPEHRVRVRGAVTLHWPEQITVLQDAAGGLVIEGGLPGPVQTGDDVEVIGFLKRPLESARLINAQSRRLGVAKEITARLGTLAEAAGWSNQLVRLAAEVVAWQPPRDGEISAVLLAGEQHFLARLPAAGANGVAAAFPPGAQLNVTGVLRSALREANKTPGLTLLLRGPADLALVRAAPQSPWRWVWIVSVVTVAVALTAAGVFWFFSRRYQRVVAAAALRQANTESRFTEMERQLRSAHRERELIAQELHDNIIQSIYSVGLGLDEARRLAGQNPERLPERLEQAVGGLNAVIRDVRAFLGGLEPEGLDGNELKGALKSVLLASGEDQQARFSIRIDPAAAGSLTPAQATEVFNIAREAMTNSMRHAQAELTTVTLLATGRGVRLEIADNGAGFDPTKLERDSLGLRHMQQRAQSIGATWQLEAAPGKGTRIIVDISSSPLLTLPAINDNQ